MKRDEKIKLLKAIQASSINLNNIEALPEYNLTAITADLSEVILISVSIRFI